MNRVVVVMRRLLLQLYCYDMILNIDESVKRRNKIKNMAMTVAVVPIVERSVERGGPRLNKT